MTLVLWDEVKLGGKFQKVSTLSRYGLKLMSSDDDRPTRHDELLKKYFAPHLYDMLPPTKWQRLRRNRNVSILCSASILLGIAMIVIGSVLRHELSSSQRLGMIATGSTLVVLGIFGLCTIVLTSNITYALIGTPTELNPIVLQQKPGEPVFIYVIFMNDIPRVGDKVEKTTVIRRVRQIKKKGLGKQFVCNQRWEMEWQTGKLIWNDAMEEVVDEFGKSCL